MTQIESKKFPTGQISKIDSPTVHGVERANTRSIDPPSASPVSSTPITRPSKAPVTENPTAQPSKAVVHDQEVVDNSDTPYAENLAKIKVTRKFLYWPKEVPGIPVSAQPTA